MRAFESLDDPRLSTATYRVVSGGADRTDGVTSGATEGATGAGHGTVVLVGVVHDHPASVFRARTAVEAVDPAVVAVELPDLALPLFEHGTETDGEERAATDGEGGRETVETDGGEQRFGDEMSAALWAADGETVGIDGIDAGFLSGLAGTLRAEDASAATVRRTARSVAGIGRRALACRVAAVTDRGGPTTRADGPADFDCTTADDPATQAADERRHRSRSRSLLAAIERPHADRVLDATREAAMVRRLASLRRSGDVVAVVGFDHLDAVADGLCEASE